MGRSRGGLTTKIHAVVDAEGLPITLKLTAGQAHDGRSADGMLDSVGEGDVLLADRGYDSDALRDAIAARGAWANIKPMPNRRNVRRSAPSSTDIAIWSSVSSTASSTSVPSPHDTTSATTTASPPSNSHQFVSGCGIMRR